MTVHDLIEVLKSMPADAEVWLSVLDFDGSATLKGIEIQSAGQMVILSDRLPAPRPSPPPPPPPPPTEQECHPGPVEPDAAYVRGTWNGAGWTWPTLCSGLVSIRAKYLLGQEGAACASAPPTSRRVTRPVQRRQPLPSDWGLGVTVCIAGIACSGSVIVAVSDRRITYGNIAADVATIEKAYKIHPQWVAMFAGNDIGNVTPILDRVRVKLSTIQAVARVDVAREFRGAFRAHRRTLIEERVLAPLDMTVKEFRTEGLAQLGPTSFNELFYEAKQTEVQCEFLVCGFADDEPQIFVINDHGLSYYERIGYWAVGSGGYSAISSLAFRRYHRGLPFPEALYQILEAKFMADTAVPTVGKATYTLTIEKNGALGYIDERGVDKVRTIWENEGQPRTPLKLDDRMPSAVYSAVSGVSATAASSNVVSAEKNQLD